MVCDSIDGLPNPSGEPQVFQETLICAGPPYFRYHDLPHTATALLLAHRKPPKMASEMLGHVTITLALDSAAIWFRSSVTRRPPRLDAHFGSCDRLAAVMVAVDDTDPVTTNRGLRIP